MKFKAGDKVKFNKKEYEVLDSCLSSWNGKEITSVVDEMGNMSDFWASDLELAQPPFDSTIPQSITGFSYISPIIRTAWNTTPSETQPGFLRTPVTKVPCCQNQENLASYTNFYQKEVKYCKKCGKGV